MSSFTITTHQIFTFGLILYSILGKLTKFGRNWLKNKKVTGKNKTQGGKHLLPLVLIGLILIYGASEKVIVGSQGNPVLP